MRTQVRNIIRHLVKEGSISNVEAQAVYKIRALPRRISDIEQFYGIMVKREWKKDPTGQRYMRYSLDTPVREYARHRLAFMFV